MSKYPEVVTVDMLARWDHLSDEEIAQDIRDTQREIDGYERTMKAEREVASAHPDTHQRRMADFRAGARPGQMAERQAFVDFLRRIQNARAVAANAASGAA